MSSTAEKLHAESIVIDAVCPLVSDDPQYLDWYRAGGITALAPTIASTESARSTLNRLGKWHRWLRERAGLQLVRRAEDIEHAKAGHRLGVWFHFQGVEPIEDNLDLIDVYKQLGVGVVQLAYNVRNRVGDGCEEPSNAGLSRFGARLIERLNQARVIVDCSHTGVRTSLDAIECSKAPVILSHSNVDAIHSSARNAPAALIQAIAKSGGVIGIAGFPGMVAEATAPSLDQFIAHIDSVVAQVGIDHVGLGLDYYSGQAGIASDEVARRNYDYAVREGLWTKAYPPPPHHYPAGIETPRSLANLTSRLLEREYTDSDVRKLLGGNWMRVMRTVWG